MIIIIDSIDRVGKTTLATKLAENLNGKIYKHAIKTAIELITVMHNMGFIDKYGKWTDAGRDYTEQHFDRRFMYFINYSMRSRVDFTRNYESLYNYLKENGIPVRL